MELGRPASKQQRQRHSLPATSGSHGAGYVRTGGGGMGKVRTEGRPIRGDPAQRPPSQTLLQASSDWDHQLAPKLRNKRNPPLGFRTPRDGLWGPGRPSLGPGVPPFRPPEAAPNRPKRDRPPTSTEIPENAPSAFCSPLEGSCDPERPSLGSSFAPGVRVFHPQCASADLNGTVSARTGPGPQGAQNGPKSPKGGPNGSETSAGGVH